MSLMKMKTLSTLVAMSLAALPITLLAQDMGVGAKVPEVARVFPDGYDCTYEVLTRSGRSGIFGSTEIANVPAGQGLLRLRVNCKTPDGDTIQGESALTAPATSGPTYIGDLELDNLTPTPRTLLITPSIQQVVGLATPLQLTVTARMADGTVGDVTTSETTFYESNNTAVATVDANGLVTPQGNGVAVITAINEGRLGMSIVSVRSADLASLGANPPQILLTRHSFCPSPTIQLDVQGTLTDTTEVDLTGAATGTTYATSNQNVVQVTEDGVVLPTGAGMANLTVSNDGIDTVVPVEVSANFTPEPIAFYDIGGGFTRNLDIAGDLLYTADSGNGLVIFDVDHGYVGKLGFAGRVAYDVKVRGTLAAVGLNSGIALVDVSSPQAPFELARIHDAGFVRDLWLSGDRLFAAASGVFKVYDISDPTAPTLIGAQAPSSGAVQSVAGDSALGVAVMVTSSLVAEIIQLTPARPWPIATVSLPNATYRGDDVTLWGTTVLVANGTDGIRAIDIADPDNPVLAPKPPGALVFAARGVSVGENDCGLFVAGADNLFWNATPFFNWPLQNIFTLEFCSDFNPANCADPGVIGLDADSNGIALGDGFGAVAVGWAGVQVFSTNLRNDNLGRPPVVTLQEPIDGEDLAAGRRQQIRAFATDDFAVGSVEFYVDGVLVDTDTQAPYSINRVFADGTYDLHAEAVDTVGNRGVSAPLTITATDPVPPIVNGAILGEQKVSATAGGFGGALDGGDTFGRSLAALGDNDGLTALPGGTVQTIAVGAPFDDDGAVDTGAVWLNFVDNTGMVLGEQKISAATVDFMGRLESFDAFGHSVAAIGDLDGNGVVDLAVGAPEDTDAVFAEGSIWILFLKSDGTVDSYQKISPSEGGLTGIQAGDIFGYAIASLGILEVDDNATPDDAGDDTPLLGLAVGAVMDDDGTVDSGAVHLLLLNPDGTVHHQHKISATSGNFMSPLDIDDEFGGALASPGDLDGDGTNDLIVGAFGDDDGGTNRGAVYVLLLEVIQDDVQDIVQVKSEQKIASGVGGFAGTLSDGDFFGASIAVLGNIDDDGNNVPDIAVGANGGDDGGTDRGKAFVLFMNSNGTVSGHREINSDPSFPGPLVDGAELGISLTCLGDINSDGVTDLAVGSHLDDDGALDTGSFYVFELDGIPQNP